MMLPKLEPAVHADIAPTRELMDDMDMLET